MQRTQVTMRFSCFLYILINLHLQMWYSIFCPSFVFHTIICHEIECLALLSGLTNSLFFFQATEREWIWLVATCWKNLIRFQVYNIKEHEKCSRKRRQKQEKTLHLLHIYFLRNKYQHIRLCLTFYYTFFVTLYIIY